MHRETYNTNQKKVGMAVLISVRADFIAKKIIRDKDRR